MNNALRTVRMILCDARADVEHYFSFHFSEADIASILGSCDAKRILRAAMAVGCIPDESLHGGIPSYSAALRFINAMQMVRQEEEREIATLLLESRENIARLSHEQLPILPN